MLNVSVLSLSVEEVFAVLLTSDGVILIIKIMIIVTIVCLLSERVELAMIAISNKKQNILFDFLQEVVFVCE